VPRHKLREAIGDGDDGLLKVPIPHARRAPQRAGTSHIAAGSRGTTTISGSRHAGKVPGIAEGRNVEVRNSLAGGGGAVEILDAELMRRRGLMEIQGCGGDVATKKTRASKTGCARFFWAEHEPCLNPSTDKTSIFLASPTGFEPVSPT
jgi:hypothetical protein